MRASLPLIAVFIIFFLLTHSQTSMSSRTIVSSGNIVTRNTTTRTSYSSTSSLSSIAVATRMDGTLSPSTAPLLPTLSISPPTVVFPLSFPISMSSSPSDMASYLKTTELEWTFLTQISLCLDNPIFTDLAIKQHNTSFYLTASQYYLSFERTRGTRPLYAQFLTATRNRDCTWSLKTRDGLFVSLNPNYTYLMLSEQVDDFSRFKFIKKDSYLWIQSASSGQHYWTIVNGIARLGLKQASRFVIEVWALPS